VPYLNCRMSPYAPELPANLGLGVRSSDVRALENLKPGARHRITGTFSGKCRAELPKMSACYFKLDMHVDIRRWRPGTPYR